MKRTLAILCVIACLCALCVPAMAAGTITVSVKAPADWDVVYLYVWEGDPMAGWPGTAMTKNGDWWTLEIPAGSYTNVIANNGEGKPQTSDLKMDGSADCWIVAEATAGVVYTDAACTTPFGGGASTPSTGLNSLALVGTGIPGVGEWNPGDPAGDMVKVSEGVYTKVIAALAGTTMKFKIAGNDAWDDAYNFGAGEDGVSVAYGTKLDLTNGGGSKDITLTTVNDGNVKFTIDLTGEIPTLLVEETDEPVTEVPDAPDVPAIPEGEKITVYVKFPDDWKGACVWAWKDGVGDADPSGWPGTLTLVKGDNGWWSVQVPNWVEGVLVHGNGASVQTPDMQIEAGKDVWINAYTDYKNPVFSYEEITIIPPPADGGNVEVTARPTEGLKKDEAKAEPKGQDLTVLLAIVGSVVIIAIAAVVVIVLKNKQKKA